MINQSIKQNDWSLSPPMINQSIERTSTWSIKTFSNSKFNQSSTWVAPPTATCTADRANDPVAGIHKKNEPNKFVAPSAFISWFGSISYLNLCANNFPRETVMVKPTYGYRPIKEKSHSHQSRVRKRGRNWVPLTTAMGRQSKMMSGISIMDGTWGGGMPLGISRTVATPRSCRRIK